MSVVVVQYSESTANEAEDGSITYAAKWLVVTNATTDGPRTVLAASGLPKRGDTFTGGGDTDIYASCRSRSVALASVEDTRKKWIVSLEYSTKGSSQNPQDQSGGPQDPIDYTWKLKLNTWSRQIAPDTDQNGRALVNTANEPFLPPPEYEKQHGVVVLTKNNQTHDLIDWAAAIGKVNSVAMWGLGVRCLWLRSWDVDEHWLGNGNMYFANTLAVAIKGDGWYFKPPNMGHRAFVFDPTGNKKARVILDELGVPVARPWPLDENGFALHADAVPLHFDQNIGALQKFELEEEYDLTPILPASLPGNFV
jgi:hypothetical protein